MPLFYREGRSDDDPAAQARARPFRLIQMLCVGDALLGMLIHYVAPRLDVPGEVLGMPVLEFAGMALMVIGVAGYILFAILGRAAMRRTEPPKPLR